jgi:phage gp36-like protein
MFATTDDVFRAYTRQQIADVLNRSGSSAVTNVGDDPRLIDALDAANSHVASYVRRQSEMPLVEIPARLKRAAVFFCYWFILDQQGVKEGDSRRQRFEDETAYLESIADRTVALEFFVAREKQNLQAAPVAFASPTESTSPDRTSRLSDRTFGVRWPF